MSQSFEFTSELTSTVENPSDIEAVENTRGVDTESWHNAGYEIDEIYSEIVNH